MELTLLSDADSAGDIETCRSTSGVFLHLEGPTTELCQFRLALRTFCVPARRCLRCGRIDAALCLSVPFWTTGPPFRRHFGRFGVISDVSTSVRASRRCVRHFPGALSDARGAPVSFRTFRCHFGRLAVWRDSLRAARSSATAPLRRSGVVSNFPASSRTFRMPAWRPSERPLASACDASDISASLQSSGVWHAGPPAPRRGSAPALKRFRTLRSFFGRPNAAPGSASL